MPDTMADNKQNHPEEEEEDEDSQTGDSDTTVEDGVENDEGVLEWCCPYCRAAFALKIERDLHMFSECAVRRVRVQYKRIYECPFNDGQIFYRRSNLRRHMGECHAVGKKKRMTTTTDNN